MDDGRLKLTHLFWFDAGFQLGAHRIGDVNKHGNEGAPSYLN